VAPSLSLDYSSQGRNGILGIGWSVAGLLVKAAPESISPEKGPFQTTATAAEVLKAVEGTGFLV